MKLYLGCSLYGASEEYLAFIEEIRDALRKEYALLEFVGIGDHAPEEVVRHDLSCVRECDVMIGICDAPSTGLGMEISLANSLGKPVLLLAQSEEISKMVRGNHAENPLSRFVVYSDIDNLLEQVDSFTKSASNT